MNQEEKIKEAQRIIDWAIAYLNGSIKCRVTGYRRETFQVQFFSKEDKLIMPTQINEEWVKQSNPQNHVIGDPLKMLLRNLENY